MRLIKSLPSSPSRRDTIVCVVACVPNRSFNSFLSAPRTRGVRYSSYSIQQMRVLVVSCLANRKLLSCSHVEPSVSGDKVSMSLKLMARMVRDCSLVLRSANLARMMACSSLRACWARRARLYSSSGVHQRGNWIWSPVYLSMSARKCRKKSTGFELWAP